MFARLLAFKERFGHTRVPVEWNEDSVLGRWASSQRGYRRAGTLNAERERRLEEIGFEWGSGRLAEELARHFERMLARFIAYRERHGQVPVTESRDAVLTRWVFRQREHHKAGTLREDWRLRMEAAGFQWEPLARQWEEIFARLQSFKARFGHTRVPQTWAEDRSLGKWVSRQRIAHRAGKLSGDRRLRLDETGFTWECSD